jgi:uncharacterized RDD family membrane protein YckC
LLHSLEVEEASSLPAWKQEVSARLIAHRTRRSGIAADQAALPGMETDAGQPRSARAAARVAARYAAAPTYREMLAAEIAHAARAAEAVAEADHAAQAAAQTATVVLAPQTNPAREHAACPAPEFAPGHGEPQHLYQPEADSVEYRVHPDSLPASRQMRDLAEQHLSRTATNEIHAHADEQRTSDVHPDPLQEAFIGAPEPLLARVIQFPRELIATRKARPRTAEGPLRETSFGAEESQLRIFEVEPDTISREPIAPATGRTGGEQSSGWHSIRLDAQKSISAPQADAIAETTSGIPLALQVQAVKARAAQRRSLNPAASHSFSALLDMLPLHVAPMEDRMMALLVDGGLVGAAFLLFALVFVASTSHPLAGKPALMAGALIFLAFFALYQWLFFTFSDTTPGMRYAKIALCSFDDENPTRKALRRRMGTLLLSTLSVGMGFLWAFVDDDRLAWHDRMSQTYQRSYR